MLATNNGTSPSGVKSLKISWTSSVCRGADQTPFVELSLSDWTNPGGLAAWSDLRDGTHNIEDYQKKIVKSNTVSPTAGFVVFNDFDSTRMTLVRLKPLYCNLRGVSINTFDSYDAGGNRLNIPNYFSINPIGTYNGSQQGLKVVMPVKTPLSSLYDYVLFSQDQVRKCNGTYTCN